MLACLSGRTLQVQGALAPRGDAAARVTGQPAALGLPLPTLAPAADVVGADRCLQRGLWQVMVVVGTVGRLLLVATAAPTRPAAGRRVGACDGMVVAVMVAVVMVAVVVGYYYYHSCWPPRLLPAWWYCFGDEEAEEGEVEGWIKPPLDPGPPLPVFSFRTSSSRLSLLPRPLLISIPCWVVMVYTRAGCRVHSTHFSWSSSAEKLRSRDSRAGLVEMVMEGGGGWSRPSGCFTRLDSGLSSQPFAVLAQGWRWLLLLGPLVSLGDSGSGPTKVSHRRWARGLERETNTSVRGINQD